jgi:hypothetical protein
LSAINLECSGPASSAVKSLWKAGHLVEDSQRRGELLADAMVGAVIAEQLEHWGALHPEAWARWYQLAASGGDDTSQYDTLLAIKRDPGAARVARNSWLEAAHSLEQALSASEREPH